MVISHTTPGKLLWELLTQAVKHVTEVLDSRAQDLYIAQPYPPGLQQVPKPP